MSAEETGAGSGWEPATGNKVSMGCTVMVAAGAAMDTRYREPRVRKQRVRDIEEGIPIKLLGIEELGILMGVSCAFEVEGFLFAEILVFIPVFPSIMNISLFVHAIAILKYQDTRKTHFDFKAYKAGMGQWYVRTA